MTYPSDVEEEDIHDAQDRRGEPDGEEGDEREGDTPDEGQRQGQESGQQTVNPEARSGEENVSRTPDRVESVSHIRLGQHVLKVQLSKRKRRFFVFKVVNEPLSSTRNCCEDDFLSSPSTTGTMSIIIISILGGEKKKKKKRVST